jgi:hypothetical protein
MQTITLPDGREIEIEIPDGHVCMAMDADGVWYIYEYGPYLVLNKWLPEGNSACRPVTGIRGPFEPGHWTTQIYWIEG